MSGWYQRSSGNTGVWVVSKVLGKHWCLGGIEVVEKHWCLGGVVERMLSVWYPTVEKYWRNTRCCLCGIQGLSREDACLIVSASRK